MQGVKDIKIDPSSYRTDAEPCPPIKSASEMPVDLSQRSSDVGIVRDDSERTGTFFQIDGSVVLSDSRIKNVEVMGIEQALEIHGWLRAYLWDIGHPEDDMFTGAVGNNPEGGYFIRALKGASISLPVQACLMMKMESYSQRLHNIIIAEEGSKLEIITGCASAHGVRNGLHIGVSEIFIKKGATLMFTMIHDWGTGLAVRPRTYVRIEEGGTFISNYICMHPGMTVQMNPIIYCAGKGATARLLSVLVAGKGADMDIGSRIYLQAPESRAESISRAVSKGGSITARGLMSGEAKGVRAHLECRGLVLSEDGIIRAIPELSASTTDAEMYHEAAVGKIAEEEITYLMSRGFPYDEAASIIVRGFIDVGIKGLPKGLLDAVASVASADAGI